MNELNLIRRMAGIPEKELTENANDLAMAMDEWATLINTEAFLKRVRRSEGVMQRGDHSQDSYDGLAALLRETANSLKQSASRIEGWSPKNQSKRLGR